MKRALVLLLAALLVFGCGVPASNRYVSDVFEADLPDSFERVPNADILCFAPYGDALRASSITVYTTELNWYFDSFDAAEYETALMELCGYESLTLNDVQSCRVDGNPAKRIACKVEIDQGTHDLILYAVSAERTYFFTLLNRDSDSFVAPFDQMMQSLRLKGQQS